LEKPVKYDVDAPDLFCLDLYKDFDLDRLILLAEPTKVSEQNYVEDSPPIHTGQSVPLSFRNDTAPEGTAGPSSTGF
jgi:hypothetical protein